MDFSIEAVLGALPQAGFGGLFMAVLLLLFKREASAQSRFTEEYDRLKTTYESELKSLREQISALQARIEELHLKLDIEREERRRAEDEAAQARRTIQGLA